MPTLLETERAFANAMMSGDCSQAADLVAPGRVPPEEAIAIYRNTCLANATRALRLSFPAIERLTGADFFDGAAAEFYADHPPRSGCLDDYGASFPAYLSAFPPAASLPYLGEVASLEWAVNRALRAADVPELDARQFAVADSIPPERLILIPHPSVSLLQTRFPADAIWRAVLDGDDVALSALALDGGPFFLLIAREHGAVQVTRLSETGWFFLSSVCGGRSYAESFDDGSAGELSVLLAQSVAQGRFTTYQEAS